jgi:hypothetical protein
MYSPLQGLVLSALSASGSAAFSGSGIGGAQRLGLGGVHRLWDRRRSAAFNSAALSGSGLAMLSARSSAVLSGPGFSRLMRLWVQPCWFGWLTIGRLLLLPDQAQPAALFARQGRRSSRAKGGALRAPGAALFARQGRRVWPGAWLAARRDAVVREGVGRDVTRAPARERRGPGFTGLLHHLPTVSSGCRIRTCRRRRLRVRGSHLRDRRPPLVRWKLRCPPWS